MPLHNNCDNQGYLHCLTHHLGNYTFDSYGGDTDRHQQAIKRIFNGKHGSCSIHFANNISANDFTLTREDKCLPQNPQRVEAPIQKCSSTTIQHHPGELVQRDEQR